MTIRPAAAALPVMILAAALAAPLAAQPGWGAEPGWNREPGWGMREPGYGHEAPSREGKVDVARFRAEGDAALALGKGTISVIAAPADASLAEPRELATYEAAVIDRLAKAGYDVATADPAGGQVTELRIVHAEVAPQEAPHKPVSGAMTMGVSNRGSMMGMALAVDLSKPRKALISTRLEARIKDRKSGTVLWEGRAEIVTRAGDSRWGDGAIAARLAQALFDGFPTRTDGLGARR